MEKLKNHDVRDKRESEGVQNVHSEEKTSGLKELRDMHDLAMAGLRDIREAIDPHLKIDMLKRVRHIRSYIRLLEDKLFEKNEDGKRSNGSKK